VESQAKIQILSIIGSSVLLVVILELVRRRRLLERYALLWLFSAVVLLALGIVLVLLLHFSLAVSRHADQTKVLAQRLALLEERVRQAEQTSDQVYEQAESRFESAGRPG
jgi:hypothetical protein